MRHPPRAWTRDARSRAHAHLYADSSFQAEPTETAKANARAGALHGFVLAVAILLIVLPIILLTQGCAADLIAAELWIPGVLLNARLSV
jgi:hypothetical protein